MGLNKEPLVQTDVPLEVFHQAVEQAALAISITDPEAHILYTNPAFQQLTGYGETEVIGLKESILSYKVTPRLVYETMWAQLLRQRPWNGLLVNRRKDGSRYLAELTITPVVNDSGQTTHYLGMHRDVTEIHHLERQVQNQKTLIESVVDGTPVAIVLLDEQEKVVLDNPAHKKLIGDIGSEPAATILSVLRQRMGETFQQNMNGAGFAGYEVQIDISSPKPRWFTCSGAWIEELDASADAFYEPQYCRYMLLTFQDISALKEQQETIRVNSLRALLAEEERIRSLREALSGAVYRLQGPVNMLAAAMRMMERRQDNTPEPLWTHLEEAHTAAREALESLRACIPAGIVEAAQPVNLNELLHDVLRIATPHLLAAGVVVEWQPAQDLAPIQARAQQLSGMFKQLLDNALDAIGDTRGKRRELRVALFNQLDHVKVIIEDSGPGIPAELRFKVFEPFFTTKGAKQGHIGMGLTMAQDVVADHGGIIEIDPTYTDGCRICIQLPR